MAGKRRLPAFTLVELIVVITIITILLTVGALGLKNLSKASGVTATVPIAEAVFAEARAIAIGRGTAARVLIYADKNDEERYLRFMLVAYLDKDGKWIAENRGTSLPDGIYFSQKLSKVDHAASTDSSYNIKQLSLDIYNPPKDSSSDPVKNQRLSGSYYLYEYNSEGDAVDPREGEKYKVSSFVIGVGSKQPGVDNPKASDAGAKNFSGFVVWRKGSTSVFRHPDQIDKPFDQPLSMEAGNEF